MKTWKWAFSILFVIFAIFAIFSMAFAQADADDDDDDDDDDNDDATDDDDDNDDNDDATDDDDAAGDNIFEESFDEGLPDTWAVQVIDGDGEWTLFEGTDVTFNNLTIPYMTADASAGGTAFNVDLITPVIDLTAYTYVELTFSHHFLMDNDGTSVGTISVFNGTDWTDVTVINANREDVSLTLDISQYVAGMAGVQIKWNYSNDGASAAGFWAIDNVIVAEGQAPTDDDDTGGTDDDADTGGDDEDDEDDEDECGCWLTKREDNKED